MKTFFKIFLIALSGAVLVLLGAFIRFQRRVNAEVRSLFANARKGSGRVVTADMLKGLPEPVQRYLTYSGVIGKPFVETVHIRQVGKFRPGFNQPWMDLSADQYYSVTPPAFIWDATLKMGGLPLIRIRDRYENGQGNMFAKMAAIYPLFDEKGDKLTQGAMVRYLSEMIWFPSAFLGENITWKAIDDHSAEVTLSDAGKSVSATMFFDESGRLVDLVANRYSQATDSFETWSTPGDEFGELAGIQMGVRGRATWKLASGDFTYIDIQLTEAEYNRPIA